MTTSTMISSRIRSGFCASLVFVLWLVHSSLALQTVHVAIGQVARLHCLVGITGKINVEWVDPLDLVLTINNDVLTQDQRFTIRHPYVKEWILEIKDVRRSDAGKYRCRIGPLPEISHYVELIVTIPSEITKASGGGSYELNSTVTLSCVAAGEPAPKITWHRIENHKLTELNVEGNRYVIEALSLSTDGVYECHATNRVLHTAKAALEVHALFAPIVTVPYKEVIQEEGKWTQLSCLITMNPESDAYWIQNGQRVANSASHVVSSQDGDRYQKILRLSITSLSYSDFGQYECRAENVYGKDSRQMTVSGEQRQKPVVISRPRDVTAAVGEDALFNCSVLHLQKDDQLVWWHRTTNDTEKLFEFPPTSRQNSKKTAGQSTNSVEIAKHDIVGQYNLLIRRTNFSDQGLYICQITGHGNLSATLDVIVSRDQAAFCQDKQYAPFNLNSVLIVLGVVVVILLVVAIVVIVLVCRLMVRRSQKDEEYLNPVQLNAKISKIDQ